MTKIIAPKVQHDIISKYLLEEETTIVDTQILPLNAFINELVPIEEDNYDKIFKLELEKVADELKLLSHYLDNSTFIKSIKDFHIDMYLYDIKLEDLNNNSVKDQDLKIIFTAIYDIIPKEIKILELLKKRLSNQSLKDVYISKQKLSSNYLVEVVKLLKSFGLQDFKEKEIETNKVELYYANNKRSEIEASAQMIVKNKLNSAQVIVLNNDYLPLIEQIYSRYNLDFNLVNPSSNKTFFINFIKIIKLIEDPSELSVKEFLSSNPFDFENISSLIKLNDLFSFDLNQLLAYKYIPIEDSIVHKSNLELYKEISKQALQPIENLKNILDEIKDLTNKFQLIEYFFNYFLNKEESNALKNLRQLLIRNKELLNTSSDVWPILERILLNDEINSVDIDKIVVTGIQDHYYFNKENVIILGASANNYPVIKKNSGVIDEKYLEKLDYPSKAKRFDKQLKDQESILQGENIYIFYPLSSYAGKAIEPSFSLINFAKKHQATPIRYDLVENDDSEYKTYQLDKLLAQKLFFKEDKLSGSISSFEQYNNCNYSYFLKSGLKLYPEELPDLSYAYIGSIIHKVMETVTNRSISHQDSLTTSELVDLVNKLAIPLEALNPNNEKTRIIKHLLIRQLNDVLGHLKNIELDTTFKPIKSEAEFFYTINNNINLKGYVDRTDQYLDTLRVIDFKSSNKSLSEKKFKQGLQLQLITYLLVMSDQYSLKPGGAFYHTMRINNTNVIAAEAKKTKEMYYPLTEETVKDKFLANNRLAGWHFTKPESYYSSNNYVGGLTENKSGLAVYGKPKNFDTVITILEKIYKDIYTNISEGIIDCVPIDNPCAFCKYHSICLSKTTQNYKEEIFKHQKLSEEINNEVD